MPHGMGFFVALRDGTDSSQGGLATQEKGAGFKVPWDGTDASRDGFFLLHCEMVLIPRRAVWLPRKRELGLRSRGMVLMPHGMIFVVALRDGTDASQGGLDTQEKGAGFEVQWDEVDASRDGFNA